MGSTTPSFVREPLVTERDLYRLPLSGCGKLVFLHEGFCSTIG